MAISASSIASSSTLNELRTQFNNLVTDVSAIEGGSISYTTLNTTNLNSTTLNVKEDGTIIFEGATDDGFETTLTVVDPTADRTITFPNASGTVIVSDSSTNVTTLPDDLLIKDGGTIGSASDADAITIGADGDITLTQDLELQHDGAILSFGADDDTTLTHTDGSGLTLNSTNKLMFNDASQFIQGASATVLDIAATDEIELTATLIDVVGNAAVSGTLDVTGVTTSNAGVVVDNITIDGTEIDLSSGDLTVDVAGDIILDVGGAECFFATAGTNFGKVSQDGSNNLEFMSLVSDKDIFIKGNDGGATITALTLDMSAAGAAIFNNNVTVGDDLKLITDASVLSFGVNSEIALTHVHNTGLLLTDSGGSPTLQLHDAGESLSSDGSKLILTSNSVAFNFPNADGTDGQVLKTDGSGTLSFITASANTPSSADGQALGSASLEWSDLFLADGGTIQFGNDQDTILTHTDGSGLTLNSTNKLMFNDASQFIQGASATVLDIAATDEIELTATLIEVVGNATVSGTLGVTGIATFTDDIIIGDGKTIGSATDVDAIAIGSDGDVTLTQDLELQHDGAILSFGANDEIALTHVHNTGLLLTDSGGTPTLQLHDANESVSSDGGHLIFTSNGVAFDFPSADGSDGQVLKTDGSGVLSFVTASANTPSSADGQALGSASLEWSDLFLADSGTIQFGNDQDTTLTHTDGSGLTLNSTNKLMFNDASQFIQGASATVLDIAATDEIELTATLIDVVGNLTASGVVTANAKLDLNGTELILDADADSSITADTDDKIDYRIGGADVMQMNATAFSGGAIYENADDIAANYSITAGKNAFSVGPITIASGVTVTVPTGQRWVIL